MSENILGYFEFNEILILEQEININGHHLFERTEKSQIYGMSKIITNERKIDKKFNSCLGVGLFVNGLIGGTCPGVL